MENSLNAYTTWVKILTVVTVWQTVSTRLSLRFYLSSPQEVLSYLISGVASGSLVKHAFTTGEEIAFGLPIGIVVGVSLGFLFWYSNLARQLLKPVVSSLQIMPIFLLAPLVVLWFGIGLKMKIIIVCMAVSVTVLTQVYEGTKTIRRSDYFVLESFGASKMQILRHFMIPATFSWVRVGVRSSLQAAILAAVIGEFISSSSGLGYHLIRQASLYNATGVLGGSVILILLSQIFFWIIDSSLKKLSPRFS
jgi:NitT/TauT family transport system permease protein